MMMSGYFLQIDYARAQPQRPNDQTPFINDKCTEKFGESATLFAPIQSSSRAISGNEDGNDDFFNPSISDEFDCAFPGAFATTRVYNHPSLAQSQAAIGVLRATANSAGILRSSAGASVSFADSTFVAFNGQGTGIASVQYEIHLTGRLNTISNIFESFASADVRIEIRSLPDLAGDQELVTTQRLFSLDQFGGEERIDTVIVSDPFFVNVENPSLLGLHVSLNLETGNGGGATFQNTLRLVGAIAKDAEGNVIDDFTLASSSYDYKAGVAIVPEPSAFVLAMFGVLGFVSMRRKQGVRGMNKIARTVTLRLRA